MKITRRQAVTATGATMLASAVGTDPARAADSRQIADVAVIGAGVFAIFANNDPSVLQFLPPLTITDDEVDWLIDTTVAALSE